MSRRLPWSLASAGDPRGPGEAWLEVIDAAVRHPGPALLTYRGQALRLLPYPPRGTGPEGVPARPRRDDPEAPKRDRAALAAMRRVLTRLEDVEEALGDPARLWLRLRAAWERAEDDAEPRMAEIVRQAQDLARALPALEGRLRRVLRRDRARVPLDRVREMDRGSMTWLARQPGTTVAERAGGAQRIMALVRREAFDTLENRVVRAYAALAARVARAWCDENARARGSERFGEVTRHRRLCVRLDRALGELGVRRAEAGVTPNYVLVEDRDYRAVREAWERLLDAERVEDDLWAWQAQGWIDFCALAVTAALDAIEGAELVAQAPLVWLPEASQGRRLRHDRPLAVVWLRTEGLVVEVQPRPEGVTEAQWRLQAPLWLRVTNLRTPGEVPMRVPIWATHAFAPPELEAAAAEALALLGGVRDPHSRILDGLVVVPAEGAVPWGERRDGARRVRAVGLDAAGAGLAQGMTGIAGFLRDCLGAAS